MAQVGIIMGSASDLPVMQEAIDILKELGIDYEVDIVSAHRTPEKMMTYGQEAHLRGIKVIVAGAGGAAHLPGMVASLTPLPVLGVPIESNFSNGMDSLLSIVQMPKGIPVGTLAIGEDGSINAALLAASIIGNTDAKIKKKLDQQSFLMLEKYLKLTKKN